eukprot:6266985-Prymnesium_polylepis.2
MVSVSWERERMLAPPTLRGLPTLMLCTAAIQPSPESVVAAVASLAVPLLWLATHSCAARLEPSSRRAISVSMLIAAAADAAGDRVAVAVVPVTVEVRARTTVRAVEVVAKMVEMRVVAGEALVAVTMMAVVATAEKKEMVAVARATTAAAARAKVVAMNMRAVEARARAAEARARAVEARAR